MNENVEIEEYKVYMYTMFAKELARNIKRYLVGKVYCEPDIPNDKIVVTIDAAFNTDLMVCSVKYTASVSDCIKIMKSDSARNAAKAVVKDYKDSIWDTFFKTYKNKEAPKPKKESKERTDVEVKQYDSDIRRLYFNEHMSEEQIADALNIHVKHVNDTLSTLID